jgi:glycosyltransferase involved in cell wall biosynthesis
MTMHGGAREFVRDGSDGILVDPLDAPRFADALRSLVGDPSRRAALAEAGKLRVREYGWDAVVDRYEQLYADVAPLGGAR